MATQRQRYTPPFIGYLVEQGILKDHPLALIDVGASGGIEDNWMAFKDCLLAVGFDPLIAEVARLNALKAAPNISYHATVITSPEKVERPAGHVKETRGVIADNQTFNRSSAVRATNLQKLDLSQRYDPSGEGSFTEERTTLDHFASQHPEMDIDFIKIDTDGADYDVLLGAADLLARKPVLGVFIESQFHGPIADDANLFCNIDRFVRARGFSLFDLEVHRYSRATLPKPFVYPFAAQTHEGQAMWADALYLRDAVHPRYADMWDVRLSSYKLVKLACLFELYGLEDCAAELLCKERKAFEALLDVDYCLDLLTPHRGDQRIGFRAYNSWFETHLNEWFPNVAPPTIWQRAVRRVIRILSIWA